jgi:hypothetical protein
MTNQTQSRKRSRPTYMHKCDCVEICNVNTPEGENLIVTEWTAKKFKEHLDRVKQIQADKLEAASSSRAPMEIDIAEHSIQTNGNFIYTIHICISCKIYKSTYLFHFVFLLVGSPAKEAEQENGAEVPMTQEYVPLSAAAAEEQNAQNVTLQEESQDEDEDEDIEEIPRNTETPNGKNKCK